MFESAKKCTKSIIRFLFGPIAGVIKGLTWRARAFLVFDNLAHPSHSLPPCSYDPSCAFTKSEWLQIACERGHDYQERKIPKEY